MAIDGTFEGLEISDAARKQITNDAKEIIQNKIKEDAKTTYITDAALDVEAILLATGASLVGSYIQASFVESLTKEQAENYNLLEVEIINKKKKRKISICKT
jgi:hypothetical protein